MLVSIVDACPCLERDHRIFRGGRQSARCQNTWGRRTVSITFTKGSEILGVRENGRAACPMRIRPYSRLRWRWPSCGTIPGAVLLSCILVFTRCTKYASSRLVSHVSKLRAPCGYFEWHGAVLVLICFVSMTPADSSLGGVAAAIVPVAQTVSALVG
jgi:hypothetical protein